MPLSCPAASQDPKIQNSKFLQFVSKMSRGELIMEDNQVGAQEERREGRPDPVHAAEEEEL